MSKALKGLLGSKKAMMAFISAIVYGVGKLGLDWDAETLYPIVAPLWGYIAAQAGADWGKSKAEIESGGQEPDVPASGQKLEATASDDE